MSRATRFVLVGSPSDRNSSDPVNNYVMCVLFPYTSNRINRLHGW
jgi:hypothetical protein